MRLLLALLTLIAGPAFAQTVTDPAQIALVCAYNSAVPAPVSGQYAFVQCDSTGKLITVGSGGSITANTTTTSGFSAGNLLYSDGSKVQALTTTLSGNNITFPGSVAVPAGAAATPSFVVGAGQTGLYSTASGTVGLSSGGVSRFEYGIAQAGAFTIQDTIIYFGASAAAMQRTSGQNIGFGAGAVSKASLGSSGILAAQDVIIGFNSSTNVGSLTPDTAISRSAAGVLAVGTGAQGSVAGQIYAATVRTGQTTVAGLPSAATAGTGARAFVTDATACTFATAVVGGGSTACPVYSDGSTWKGG